MAMLYKSDVNPGGPVLSYEDLARLFQRAETGRDAAAAIAFARLPDAEKRLARGLVSAFTSKADSAPQPAGLALSVYDPDPAVRALAWRMRRRQASS